MVKCVVSSCPNRTVSVTRGTFHRTPKRFFSLPADPARLQVWWAALRQTDRPDGTEQRLICEDHFLPEDISTEQVHQEAIPITPLNLDGDLGLISSCGASEEEEEEEEGEEDEDDEDEEGAAAPLQLPPDGGSQLGPGAAVDPEEPETSSAEPPQRKHSPTPYKGPRHNFSLGLLTRRFLELLWAAPDGWLDIRRVASSLQTGRRRVYDITNVLEGIQLLQKDSAHRVKWKGKHHLWKNKQQLQKELEKLQQVEDTLDSLIKTCARQLFDLTDDSDNSASAYVTLDDVAALQTLQEKTLIVIEAPEETKLEIPAPKEDSIQVHLKAGKGPITVSTCEIGTKDAVTSDPAGTGSGFFMSLEQSRVRMRELHTWKR